MHAPHDHAHHHAHPSAVSAGISLLRLSGAARLGLAFALSLLIWLIVYLVLR